MSMARLEYNDEGREKREMRKASDEETKNREG